MPTAPQDKVEAICRLAHELDQQDSARLSFRQLARLTLRAAFQPDDSAALRSALIDCTMMPFMPLQSQEAFGMMVDSAGFNEVSRSKPQIIH